MNSNKYKKGSVLSNLSAREKYQYGAGILLIFVIILGTLYTLGLVPETFRSADPLVDLPIKSEDKALNFIENLSKENTKPDTFTTPDRVYIPEIGVDSKIQKPQTQDILTLDNALKQGAVYYPGSGSIEEGNVFLFGHSTNWPIVQNQAYKTFNGLEKLERGEEIILEADGKEYIYRVDRVNLVDENTAFVNFENTGNTLTISTCNTFGKKQERWVVVASFYRERNI